MAEKPCTFSTEEASLRLAIDQWHTRLRRYMAGRTASTSAANEDSEIPMPMVTALSEILETLKAIQLGGIPRALKELPGKSHCNATCANSAFAGVASPSGDTSPDSTTPGGGSGVAVHETSIGRRASASYNVYDRIGGWETLSAAVDGMYRRLFDDPRVDTNFKCRRDEQRLKTQALEFMSIAFGGKQRDLIVNTKDSYSHHRPGRRGGDDNSGVVTVPSIPGVDFDIMLEHLKAVMQDLNLPKDAVSMALCILRSSRGAFEINAAAPEEPSSSVAATAEESAGAAREAATMEEDNASNKTR